MKDTSINRGISYELSVVVILCVYVFISLFLFPKGLYMCYWPHSLRYRRRIDKRLLSNIESVDDDDL